MVIIIAPRWCILIYLCGACSLLRRLAKIHISDGCLRSFFAVVEALFIATSLSVHFCKQTSQSPRRFCSEANDLPNRNGGREDRMWRAKCCTINGMSSENMVSSNFMTLKHNCNILLMQTVSNTEFLCRSLSWFLFCGNRLKLEGNRSLKQICRNKFWIEIGGKSTKSQSAKKFVKVYLHSI